jgi:uncharacterized protein YlxP (DUF503 family)
MAHAIVGLCTVNLYLPGVGSLKEKRSILRSLLKRIQNTFNASAAEVGSQDVWQSAQIAVAVVTNATPHAHQMISSVLTWIETSCPNVSIVNQQIEIL